MKAFHQSPKSFGSAASAVKQLVRKPIKPIVDNRPTMVAQCKLQALVQMKRKEVRQSGVEYLRGLEVHSGQTPDSIRDVLPGSVMQRRLYCRDYGAIDSAKLRYELKVIDSNIARYINSNIAPYINSEITPYKDSAYYKSIQKQFEERKTRIIEKFNSDEVFDYETVEGMVEGTELGSKDIRRLVNYIGSKIPKAKDIDCETGGLDCDPWARKFHEELKRIGIPYTPVKVRICPKGNKNALAPGARMILDGKIVGHNSHFYTIVKIDEKDLVFDNLNPLGKSLDGYCNQFSMQLLDGKDKDGEDMYRNIIIAEELVQVEIDEELNEVKPKQSKSGPNKPRKGR